MFLLGWCVLPSIAAWMELSWKWSRPFRKKKCALKVLIMLNLIGFVSACRIYYRVDAHHELARILYEKESALSSYEYRRARIVELKAHPKGVALVWEFDDLGLNFSNDDSVRAQEITTLSFCDALPLLNIQANVEQKFRTLDYSMREGSFNSWLWGANHQIAARVSTRWSTWSYLDTSEDSVGEYVQTRIYKARCGLESRLKSHVPKGYASWLASAIGDESGFSDAERFAYKATGTIHLIAVSGTQVSLIFMALWFASALGLKLLLQERAYCFLAFLPLVLTWIALPQYLKVCGAPGSCERATYFLMLWAFFRSLGLRADVFTLCKCTYLLLLLVQPELVLDLGLQLSLAGVLGLSLASYPHPISSKKEEGEMNAYRGKLRRRCVLCWDISLRFCIASLGASALTTPLVIATIGQIARYQVVTNIIVVPIVSLTQAPALILTLCGVTFDVPWLSRLGVWMAEIMNRCVVALAHTMGRIDHYPMGFPGYATALLFLFYFLIRSCNATRRLLFLGSGLFILQHWGLTPQLQGLENEITLNFIDVGHGDATLIRDKNKTILIDAGASLRNGELGENARIVRSLNELQVATVDVGIATHFDDDHFGGFVELAKEGRLREFWGVRAAARDNPKALAGLERIRKNGTHIRDLCDVNLRTISDTLHLIKLGPFDTAEGCFAPELGANDNSVVLGLQVFGLKVLMMGDAGWWTEDSLLADARAKRWLQGVDIVKVGHHGSASSSSIEFLREASPRVALVSNGRRNRFALPNDLVEDRLHRLGVATMTTGCSGTITLHAKREAALLSGSRLPLSQMECMGHVTGHTITTNVSRPVVDAN